MTIVVYWLPRHQFHAMSAKTLEVGRPGEFAIEPWRRNFQHIRSTTHYILNVEDGAELPAECRTISVRYSIRMLRSQRRAGAIYEHPQHAVLAGSTKLDIHDFQSA